jgi:hypothetical protein
MFARAVSILLTDHSAAWMFMICVCTLVTELTLRRNRPLIPAPAIFTPWGVGRQEYGY